MTILVTIFLNKGVNEPLLGVYTWLLENIPLFIIFKTPIEKFSVLLIFLVCLYLALTLNTLKIKWLHFIMVAYLIVCGIPYISLNFIPDYKIDENLTISRRFTYKPEYKNSINKLNEDGDYRVLSLPGSGNYQITMQNHGVKYYRGMDPILYAINKPFIAAYSGDLFLPIYKNIGNKNIGKYLSIYSIKKLMLNSDIFPAFGFIEKESLATISANLNKTMTSWKDGPITIYENPYFLPHIFIPRSVIELTDASPSGISRLTLQDNYQVGNIFVDSDQNFPKDLLNTTFSPKLDFQKINPDKYVVTISEINKSTPIVFNENFDKYWQLKTNDGMVVAQNTHRMVNGYANSWVLDPKSICQKKDGICTINPNGTNNIALTIEYWPKSLYFLGLWISGTSFIFLFLVFIFTSRNNKK